MADRVKEMDEEQGALEEKINSFVLALPNLPAEDVRGRRQGKQPGGKGLRRKARL